MKRIYLLFVFTLLSCMNLFAQGIKWQFGGTVGYDNFKNNGPNNPAIYQEENDYIRTRANQWYFGINVERTLPNKRFFLGSGVGLGQLNIVAKTTLQIPLFFPLPDNSFSYLVFQNGQDSKYSSTHRLVIKRVYMIIPAILRYEFYTLKRSGLYLKAGINTSIAISSSHSNIAGNSNEEKPDEDIKTKYYSNNRDVFANFQGAFGIRVGKGKFKRPNARFEAGINVPVTNIVADNKLGPGFTISFFAFYPMKTQKH